MKLHVHELYTELSQEVQSGAIVNVEAVRLHLYKHNNPAGSLTVEIRNENGVVAVGETLLISDISSEPFFHGMVRFYINAQLKNNTAYKIVLKHSGYTFSEPAYVGWATDFDFNTYDKTPTPSHALLNPFDYEVWVRK